MRYAHISKWRGTLKADARRRRKKGIHANAKKNETEIIIIIIRSTNTKLNAKKNIRKF